MPSAIARSTRGTRSKLASPSDDKQSPKTVATLTPRSTNIEVVLPSRKRKVQDDSVPTAKKLRSESAVQSTTPVTPLAQALRKVSFADPETPPAKPRPNRKVAPVPARLAATPSSCATLPASRKRRCESDETSQTEALLERLNLESPSAYKRKKTTVHRRTPPDEFFDLPQELNDLLNLHVAFLRTLDMQYAHSGRTTPVDLEALYPSVTRAWGKRMVGLVDIQRCVGVLSWDPVKSETAKAPYFLCDYGRDKICLEFHPDAEPGPLRQHKLNMDFEANLRTLWLNSNGEPASIFIGSLPKAPIKRSASATAATKSAQRSSQTTLDSFKKSIAQKKKEQEQEQQKQEQAAPLTPPQTPKGDQKKMSLLDRIRHKEQQALSQGSSAPTPAELQRRAALQRASDVAAVIGMLCKATTSSQAARVSFPMAALLGKLRDSVRTPISQEDGECCVRLLAGEVAPEWLRVLSVGGRVNVLVMVAAQPSKAALEERVASLLG
ncbi:uncharacterized protein B0T15DRAFT_509502 [Chaetomium strumarium]|uniref:DNA replication factor Cdt1 C-terminal domain-containing protein n=1 Tax=Chaetomium strumarium TaxID=1170767 RepID=A0AAJ0GZN8_9PEZI|nr:hypothetical protein B0T15DRAFT_509502 [Chaetomium strumarium]